MSEQSKQADVVEYDFGFRFVDQRPARSKIVQHYIDYLKDRTQVLRPFKRQRLSPEAQAWFDKMLKPPTAQQPTGEGLTIEKLMKVRDLP